MIMTKTEFTITIAIVGILSAIGDSFFPFEGIFLIIFGWIYFITDVFPYININQNMLVVGIITVLVLAVGVHLFLSSFTEKWRLRWSLTGLSLFILMFITSIALTGFVHQMTWLINGSPLTDSKINHFYTINDMKAISVELAIYHKEQGEFPKSTNSVDLQVGILPYSGSFKDRWGTPFKYNSDGQSYILKSYGANRIIGGGIGQFDDIIYINGQVIKTKH